MGCSPEVELEGDFLTALCTWLLCSSGCWRGGLLGTRVQGHVPTAPGTSQQLTDRSVCGVEGGAGRECHSHRPQHNWRMGFKFK